MWRAARAATEAARVRVLPSARQALESERARLCPGPKGPCPATPERERARAQSRKFSELQIPPRQRQRPAWTQSAGFIVESRDWPDDSDDDARGQPRPLDSETRDTGCDGVSVCGLPAPPRREKAAAALAPLLPPKGCSGRPKASISAAAAAFPLLGRKGPMAPRVATRGATAAGLYRRSHQRLHQLYRVLSFCAASQAQRPSNWAPCSTFQRRGPSAPARRPRTALNPPPALHLHWRRPHPDDSPFDCGAEGAKNPAHCAGGSATGPATQSSRGTGRGHSLGFQVSVIII